jgi:hypothetical protein
MNDRPVGESEVGSHCRYKLNPVLLTYPRILDIAHRNRKMHLPLQLSLASTEGRRKTLSLSSRLLSSPVIMVSLIHLTSSQSHRKRKRKRSWVSGSSALDLFPSTFSFATASPPAPLQSLEMVWATKSFGLGSKMVGGSGSVLLASIDVSCETVSEMG